MNLNGGEPRPDGVNWLKIEVSLQVPGRMGRKKSSSREVFSDKPAGD